MTVAKLRRSSKADKSDGFKFAVTLIVAFSTVGYRIYNYVNNNPVDDSLCMVLNILIPISLTIILGLIVYITIKGMSLEINNPKLKEQYEKTSSSIYISTFMLLIFFLIIKICDSIFNKYLMRYFDQDGSTITKVFFTIAIFVMLFYKILDVDNSKKSVPYVIFLCAVTALVLSGFIISPYLLAGEIKVEMDDIYYTNDTRIPIYVVNTGYNGDIIIDLNETNTEDIPSTLDSIELHVDDSNESTPGEYLYINTLSYGKYKVFIDTTNLTQGYYRLSVSEESHKSQWLPILERVFPITHKKDNVFYFSRN